MYRLASGLAVGATALLAGSSAFAADFTFPGPGQGSMRPAFSTAFDNNFNDNSPISMSAGINYWYSRGGSGMSVGGDNYSSRDTSHVLEGVARVDDHSTNSYVKAFAGMAAKTDGTYETPSSGGTQSLHSGHIYYGGADFGWMPLGNDSFHIGGLIGYQYWNDSPDMGRVNYTDGSGSGYSQTNDIAYQMLRLGIAAQASLGSAVDIDASLAYIPFASLRGTYGAYSVPTGFGFTAQNSPGTVYGHLYGAAGQIMVGFHPTDHLTLKLGARAWYLTGPAKLDYSATDSSGIHAYTANTDSYSVWRYGLLAGLDYRF